MTVIERAGLGWLRAAGLATLLAVASWAGTAAAEGSCPSGQQSCRQCPIQQGVVPILSQIPFVSQLFEAVGCCDSDGAELTRCAGGQCATQQVTLLPAPCEDAQCADRITETIDTPEGEQLLFFAPELTSAPTISATWTESLTSDLASACAATADEVCCATSAVNSCCAAAAVTNCCAASGATCCASKSNACSEEACDFLSVTSADQKTCGDATKCATSAKCATAAECATSKCSTAARCAEASECASTSQCSKTATCAVSAPCSTASTCTQAVKACAQQPCSTTAKVCTSAPVCQSAQVYTTAAPTSDCSTSACAKTACSTSMVCGKSANCCPCAKGQEAVAAKTCPVLGEPNMAHGQLLHAMTEFYAERDHLKDELYHALLTNARLEGELQLLAEREQMREEVRQARLEAQKLQTQIDVMAQQQTLRSQCLELTLENERLKAELRVADRTGETTPSARAVRLHK